MHNHRGLDSDANQVGRVQRPIGVAEGASSGAYLTPWAPRPPGRPSVRMGLAAAALSAIVGAIGSCSTPAGNSYISCHTVKECTTASTPICDAESLLCRACIPSRQADDTACRNGHPETPRCGPSGVCVACMINKDCPDQVQKPACRNYTCGPCQQATDCLSLICSNDGSCAQIADVAFVDNKNGSCQGATHQGTMADPYCQIKDALAATAAGGKSLISVAVSSKSYDAVKIVGGSGPSTITISGAGTELGSVVIEGDNGEPAVAVSSTNEKITVVLRNLDLVGAPGIYSVVQCNDKVDLSVTGSRVHDGGKNGIESVNCQLTVDAVRIYNTNNIGLSISGGSYAVSNVMLWRNYVAGIAFSGSTGTLRFATVANNGFPSNDKVSGIDCGTGMNLVESSIVYDNYSRPLGGTSYTDLQLNGCKLSQVVTNDTTTVDGTVRTRVDFVNESGTDASKMDFRLVGNSTFNSECCIDKVTQVGSVVHDIDFQKRPAGSAADIGAFEVQK